MTCEQSQSYRVFPVMLYFAYGSNMLTQRLQKRVSSAKPKSTAVLFAYELKWHKRSSDGSGKCDIAENKGSMVHGIIFEMDSTQLPVLDKAEGLGKGYHHQQVTVTLPDEAILEALAYAADPSHIDPTLKPYDWYYRLVVAGAIQHALPAQYIAGIHGTEFLEDPDKNRSERLEAMELLEQAGSGADSSFQFHSSHPVRLIEAISAALEKAGVDYQVGFDDSGIRKMDPVTAITGGTYGDGAQAQLFVLPEQIDLANSVLKGIEDQV
jgi:gamma-glutamylcyclotransferase